MERERSAGPLALEAIYTAYQLPSIYFCSSDDRTPNKALHPTCRLRRDCIQNSGICGERTQSWQALMRDLGSLMSWAYVRVAGYSGRQLSLSSTIFLLAGCHSGRP